MSTSDTIFNTPRGKAPFVFDEAVANVFPDMIKRSVPGYANVIAGTGLIAADYIQNNSHVYDLGCSLGASTFAILDTVNTDEFQIIAIDNSEDMLQRLQNNIQKAKNSTKVSSICSDILDIDISNASVVVLNYTLQFIPLEQRIPLLQKIYNGMLDNGVLILSEKLAFDTPEEQQRQTALHESFKRTQGYSELEIAQKRAALENVLIPEPYSAHHQRLTDIGFRETQMWFRSINFASMMAWK